MSKKTSKERGGFQVTAEWCKVCEYLLDEDGKCLECEGAEDENISS